MYGPAFAQIDGYKTSHGPMYPEGTTKVVSNFTPRMSRIPGISRVTLFGLQGFIREYIMGAWSRLFTDQGSEDLDEYEDILRDYLVDKNYSVDYLRRLQDVGYMPLQIRAIAEGSSVPLRQPMLTVHNTAPGFQWLTNYIETQISAQIWHPCTVATIAKQYYNEYMKRGCADNPVVPFLGHDFSFRGQTSCPSAGASGAAHLLFFKGSDTIPAIYYVKKYYNGDMGIAHSVPATEHSVMQCTDDMATYSRLLDLHPTGILSVVSDTWDFWAVIRDVLPALKERIMARAGCLVIRPDSGDPNLILNGNPNATDPLEKKGLIQCLWDIFGGTTNEYGVRTLDPHIGAIYGDSITLDRQKQILDGLRENKFSPASVVIGIGSYTYQYVTRDTFGFAIKATYAEINGVPTPLFKDPKTDNGIKKSAKGLIFLGNDTMEENVTWERFTSDDNRLAPIFTDGVLEAEWDWEHIRTIARNDIF